MIYMKKSIKNTIVVLIVSTLLIAGVIIAGCTQDTGNNSGSAGNSQQASPISTGDNPSPDNGGSPRGSNSMNSPPPVNDESSNGMHSWNASDPGGSQQFRGQNFLTNVTMLTAAADKLGISEQDLQNALNITSNATSGRPYFTAAAQQLGITQQQLTDALGFPAGDPGMRGGRNATAVQPTSS